MLDIKFIRENAEKVKESCKNRGVVCNIDRILELEAQRKKLLQNIEALRATQNTFQREEKNKEKKVKKEFRPFHPIKEKPSPEYIEKAKEIKTTIKTIEPELEEIEKELQRLLLQIPNIPLDDVPVGKDGTENVVVREVGKKPQFKFTPKDYLEIAEASDLIDVKRASKVSGSRFGYLKNDLALLEFALVDLVMKTAVKEDFIPIIPPAMISTETMKAMGYIDTPEDLEERYFFEKDNLFLVGTSEQSVVPMHKDEILEEKDLPKRYVAFSSCFRREAGSYGKDTKGILRVHQFDKVEFVSFTTSEKSREEHQFLLKLEEKLWQALKIPYRVVQLCTGDLARPSASTIDIEAWLPGQNQYREVSSTSNTTDFQARRLNIRVKKSDGTFEFAHILNGTGFAISRTPIAIIENYQQKDGIVKIPKVLQQYLGKSQIKIRG